MLPSLAGGPPLLPTMTRPPRFIRRFSIDLAVSGELHGRTADNGFRSGHRPCRRGRRLRPVGARCIPAPGRIKPVFDRRPACPPIEGHRRGLSPNMTVPLIILRGPSAWERPGVTDRRRNCGGCEFSSLDVRRPTEPADHQRIELPHSGHAIYAKFRSGRSRYAISCGFHSDGVALRTGGVDGPRFDGGCFVSVATGAARGTGFSGRWWT